MIRMIEGTCDIERKLEHDHVRLRESCNTEIISDLKHACINASTDTPSIRLASRSTSEVAS
jgi:hypothetical protein